jgi:hypothetical protein
LVTDPVSIVIGGYSRRMTILRLMFFSDLDPELLDFSTGQVFPHVLFGIRVAAAASRTGNHIALPITVRFVLES